MSVNNSKNILDKFGKELEQPAKSIISKNELKDQIRLMTIILLRSMCACYMENLFHFSEGIN